MFADWVPVNADNIDAIVAEVDIFRGAVGKGRLHENESAFEAADRLYAWLLKLKHSTGWKASIG